ncbi:membrane protein insertase YidC [Treponema brennaborense]|uniref:Membrane protein insertase YidC n=1 Tax=Treponema brennaborense (strain DSM 12168 / CIP 105900 / DD5/3) TaxID=906968 RepID=F4LK79_TREBD|nr:membrane protein insertase YidC [Treponema brennaborense]AEE15468.1 Membrane protein oxaA [Treponema brennaborense DSM 12168]
MEKNTVWAIILSTLVLVIFMFVQITFFPAVPAAKQTEQYQNTADVSSAQGQLPVNTVAVSGAEENGSLNAAGSAGDSAAAVTEEQFVIQNGKVKVTFTNRGGDIINYELLEHKDGNSGVEMADNVSAKNRAFSVSFGAAGTPIIDDIFSVKKIDDNTIGFYKTFTVKNNDGTESSFVFAKQYTFDPAGYMFRLDVSIDGDDTLKGLAFGNSAYTIRTSPQIGPYFDSKNNRYENRTFMSYNGSKKKKTTLGSGQSKVYDDGYTWTGVSGKYFEILGVPLNPTVMQDVTYSAALEVDNYANAQVMMSRGPITQSDAQDTYYFYVGPKTEETLKIYNNAAENVWHLSGLKLNESLESSGILFWLETFLKWCMELLYKIIPNWGVSIIILTILLKLVLFPLTKKSSLSTLKMQELQPKMQEIQAKFKDQPDKMNAEMAKLYKETGYNPLSGCLPLLIQFPLIFAMYNLFNNYFEFRGAMFIPGWIPDLSVGDSVYALNFNLPFLGNQLRLLPIIYVISQLLFGKVTQSGTAAGASGMQMKIMMYGMPLFFFFIFYNAPSGLLIYWTVSNALQLVQQVILNKTMKAKRAEIESREPEKKVFVPRKKK